jgi:hypothetical protein
MPRKNPARPPSFEPEDHLRQPGPDDTWDPQEPAMQAPDSESTDDGEAEAEAGPVVKATSYESRIRILDAWQYPGSLVVAPEWVDRNWAAWGDHDPVRAIEPGPCLRVPLTTGVNAICRVGDYVTRQTVTLVPGIRPDVRLEVWDREHFEKLFIPAGYVIEGTLNVAVRSDPNLASQARLAESLRSSQLTRDAPVSDEQP